MLARFLQASAAILLMGIFISSSVAAYPASSLPKSGQCANCYTSKISVAISLFNGCNTANPEYKYVYQTHSKKPQMLLRNASNTANTAKP